MPILVSYTLLQAGFSRCGMNKMTEFLQSQSSVLKILAYLGGEVGAGVVNKSH